ncbi:PREDICTED: probable 28S ribosomal protein S6, mitochondrial [Nicrophorus vespilloides]|uniref:Small ribosomal subunit protein bS6m n=1 Tax=Nicrophorus vespilloides TaxID=110193 RepID=A0ABM1MKK2_NICVS|nr:PREDICTED: probable 28S ribosomal protein S6, mitochondrial [Nicrophorus vespilloides]
MITYELCLLLRVMPKKELAATLKRTATAIFDKSGFIRKIENLGTRDMPYKTSSHGVVYNKASYFLIEMNVPPSTVEELKEEYSRDVDIIRRRVYKKIPPSEAECTLHEEMLPAPYRKDVQELIASSKKLQKPRFSYNSGLDYYPFQK